MHLTHPQTLSRSLRGLAAIVLTTGVVAAQFDKPYSGVVPKTRTKPLPVVVMMYQPNTPLSHKRMCVFSRKSGALYQVAKDRGSTWYKRVRVLAGVTPKDDPVTMRSSDGSTTSLFVTATNGRVYQSITRRSEYIGTWSTPSPLPGNVLMSSTCAAVNTPNNTGVTVVARGVDNYLYENFYSRSTNRWGSWRRIPRSPKMIGRPTIVNSSNGNRLYVFATDDKGVVRHIQYRRGGGGGTGYGWLTWTSVSTKKCFGSPSCYVLGTLLSVFATGADGIVYQSVLGSTGWSNFGALAGRKDFGTGPAAVNSPNGKTLDVIARTTSGDVYLRSFRRGGGGWTNWTKFDLGGTLTGSPTLMNWHTRTMTRAEARAQLFGAADSVGAWMKENSFGKFALSEAYITNWLTMPDDPKTPNVNESSYEYFHGPDNAGKARLMIRGLESLTSFRFAKYDTSPKDGRVTIDELMVYWVYPAGEGARVRGVGGDISVPSLPGGKGVSLSLGLPRSAAHIHPGTITEELCHALFGLDDLYETPRLPNYVSPGSLSLISTDNSRFPHLHPWGKMKLGWIRPTVVSKDGWYKLRAIEKHQDLLLLHNPKLGKKDYLLVENRWPVGSIEHRLKDRGLGVWRIAEHFPSQQDWGRKSIQLLRAGGGRDDTVAFFDGSDARTSYHLMPDSSPANSRFLGGKDSGIALYHVPVAGGETMVFVDVAPLRSAPPPKFVKASFDYIDQKSPFKNPSPNWLVALGTPRIDSAFRVRVPNSFFNGAYHSYFLVTGFTRWNLLHPVFDGWLYASHDIVLPAPFGGAGTTSTLTLSIPADYSLTGLRFYQQVVRTVSGSTAPFGLSRGGVGRIGG